MASILKVNTIQDATNSNTAMTIDSSGNVTTSNLTVSNPLTASSGVVHGGYELIQSKVSTAHNGLAGGSVIKFPGVFSSAYIKYKVIIGWYLHAGDSGENIELRFLTGTDTEVTTAQYRYAVNRYGDTGTWAITRSTGQTKGVLYSTIGGETNGANGGQHGELDIINVGHTTLGGVSTQRYYSNNATNVYSPIVHGSITGYSIDGSEYERQDSFIRLNSAQDPYHYTGFCFLTPSSGEAKGTNIAVYGMRSA